MNMASFNAGFPMLCLTYVPFSSTEEMNHQQLVPSSTPENESAENLDDRLQTSPDFSGSLALMSERQASLTTELIPKLATGIKKIHTHNVDLGKKIISLESRERQINTAHQALVQSLFAEIAQTEQEMAELNQSMLDIDSQTEEQLAAIERELAQEEELLARSTQAQIDAIEQEAASNLTIKQSQENEQYLQELLKLRQELDKVQLQTEQAIKQSESSVAAGLKLQARIDGPNALNESHQIIDELQDWGLVDATFKQSQEFQKQLTPAIQALDKLIQEARSSAVRLHMPSSESSDIKEPS